MEFLGEAASSERSTSVRNVAADQRTRFFIRDSSRRKPCHSCNPLVRNVQPLLLRFLLLCSRLEAEGDLYLLIYYFSFSSSCVSPVPSCEFKSGACNYIVPLFLSPAAVALCLEQSQRGFCDCGNRALRYVTWFPEALEWDAANGRGETCAWTVTSVQLKHTLSPEVSCFFRKLFRILRCERNGLVRRAPVLGRPFLWIKCSDKAPLPFH